MNIDLNFEPAWAAKAAVYEKSGNDLEASYTRQQARRIRERIWQQRVEAEIRSRHILFGKKPKDF